MTKAEKYERVHYITNRPFAEELQRLTDNPPLGSVPMDITPAMAEEMLKRNNRNRAYRSAYATELGKRMAKGQWHYTGCPIIFSKSGALIDGQHRLGGCVESSTTIRTQVVFGSPDEAFAFIDVGKKRSAGDIFHINGVQNATLMAAATAKLVNIDRTWITSVAKSPAMTADELYAKYLYHDGLQVSSHYGRLFHKNKLLEISLATALHYVCARKCRRDADDFFTRVGDGVGITKKKEGAAKLRDRLDVNSRSESKLTARYKAALTIKAFNAHRAGVTIGTLKFVDGEAFPRAR